MNEKLKKQLALRGWSEKEVKDAEEILKKGRIKKTKKIILFDKYIYWVALFAGILGNIVISIVLVPFLTVLKGMLVYVVVVILGAAFGMFFEMVIRNVWGLEKKHYLIAGVVVFCLALVNMLIVSVFDENIKIILKIEGAGDVRLLVGAAYSLSFIAQYTLQQLVLKKQHRIPPTQIGNEV